MRRATYAGLAVAVVVAAIVIEVLSGSSGRSRAEAAPALPEKVLVPPRVTLSSLRGKPAAINFWASWCGPCRQEAAQVERLARSVRGKASVVGVDYTDDRSSALRFVREFGLTYPILSDPEGSFGDRYGLSGLPETAILDRGGRLVQLLRGPQTAAGLRRALRSAGA